MSKIREKIGSSEDRGMTDDTDQDDDDISGSGEINLQDSHDLNYDDDDDEDDSDFFSQDNKKEGLLQREPRRSSWSKNDVIPVLQPL